MDADPNPSFAKAFRIAYLLGMSICVAWPLLLQLMLGTVIRPGEAPPGGVIQQLGYTFTGLTFAAAFFVTWRWTKVQRAFGRLEDARRPGTVIRETILYAALFELSSLYGIVYYALGGPGAERYARAFIALTTIMFFVFVPRFQAWRDAAQEERP
ncbi:hypothetical protein [Mesoterricola silvestris]|uniref:Uncharacterized protein n=1 Tax=Mesoterricola silvestris TaxID=2927979 RepID=A0AA48K9R6_9BACT|nr:hypothetical protein [Mesoterricola silvestris]BDU73791.1 hypothetical protein METEAL_29650 [Mesoterricola silvestris]